MTATDAGSVTTADPASRFSRPQRLAIQALVLLSLLSLTRMWTGFDNLTSSGTIGAALRLTVPILLAGLAALWSDRVGVVNIGIEGMMILGTWFGAYGAWQFDPWIGLVFAIIGGMIGGLIHAIGTIRFGIDQVISGVVINLLALSGGRFLSELAFVGEVQGGISQAPPQKRGIPIIDIPFLAGGDLFGWDTPDMFGWLEERQWFLLSDLAGIGGGLTGGVSMASLLALAMVPLSAWVLWRTAFGLRMRSSGENPWAGESLGVNINRVRYQALVISGGLAGLGGGFLSIVSSSFYRQGQTAGRGFIGLATAIFGNWTPSGILGGAALFGYSEGIKLVAGGSLTGLFLFVALIGLTVTLSSLVLRKQQRALIAAAVGVVAWVGYLTIAEVPESLTQGLPYFITLVVLATASQRLRPPSANGVPYRPGEAH